ncbi:MAG: hypothetical protein WED05_08065 [Candidatus Atabeyarchaeum deiterrae]
MLTVSDKVVENNPPIGGDNASSRTVRKVVVIQVKSRGGYERASLQENREYERPGTDSFDRGEGHVVGTRVVDLNDGRVAFWILSKSPGKNLGFEVSFLQGATAAIVMLELSDWETIQSASELLRSICKEFSIPVMLVVGGRVGDDAIGLGSPVELARTASKVITYAHVGRKVISAS